MADGYANQQRNDVALNAAHGFLLSRQFTVRAGGGIRTLTRDLSDPPGTPRIPAPPNAPAEVRHGPRWRYESVPGSQRPVRAIGLPLAGTTLLSNTVSVWAPAPPMVPDTLNVVDADAGR
jgi:hypothetical protein